MLWQGVIESVRSSLTVLETFEPTDVNVVKATFTLISPLTLIPVLTPKLSAKISCNSAIDLEVIIFEHSKTRHMN